jgi:hypothetical protein
VVAVLLDVVVIVVMVMVPVIVLVVVAHGLSSRGLRL